MKSQGLKSQGLVLLLASTFLSLSTTVSAQSMSQRAAAGEAGKDAQLSKPAPIVVPLAVGTAFNASLVTDLDARRNKAGDPFTVELTEPVKYQRSVILPKGTLLTGHLVRSTAGHGRRGAGLFLQFEKAQLKGGEEALLNAGIQAVSIPSADSSGKELPEGGESAGSPESVEDVSNAREPEPLHEKSARVLETSRNTRVARPKDEMPDPLTMESPLTQGSFTKQGLFTPDSQGVFGMPDVKLYTPLSQGSNGSVLLSTRKNLRLPAGSKLLLVIQPPASAPASAGTATNPDEH